MLCPLWASLRILTFSVFLHLAIFKQPGQNRFFHQTDMEISLIFDENPIAHPNTATKRHMEIKNITYYYK